MEIKKMESDQSNSGIDLKAIYKITNLLNNKVYIGQSVHPEKRWWEHKQRARTNYDNYPIHLAITKYGEENFSFEILEWTKDYDNEEKRLINEYNSLSPNGYNILEGGSNPVMYGQNHPRNKVQDKDLPFIIQDLKENKLSDKEIAKKYNLTDKIIADINHGYSHKIKNEKYPIRIKKGSQKLTEKQAEEIKNLLKTTTLSYQKIADMYNVTKGNIYQINRGTNFKREKNTYPIRSKN